MRRASWALVLSILPSILVVPLLANSAARPLTPEQIVRRWADGPVRYLMTWHEDDELRSLHAPEDLARFITDFWAKRDPSPGTFENEYRRMFWQRVHEANKRFHYSTTPGWKTDPGKIFILLGEPFDIERTQGKERWTYQRRYSKKVDPEFYVVFIGGTLVTDSAAASPFYDFSGLKLDPGGVRGAASLGDSGPLSPRVVQGPGRTSQLETASVMANIDLGLEMSAASNSELVLATVNSRDFLSAFAARTKFEFFRAKDGSTFVNVCALVTVAELYGSATSGVTHQRLYASLEPLAPGGATRYATNEKIPARFDLAKGSEPGGLVGVWTGVAAPPGRYRVTMALEDSFTGRLGRATAEIDVPDFSVPRLALSTPVLASALAEASDRMDVTARSSGVFRKSETFGVYYELYGLGEERGGEVAFDVSYLFYRDLPEGAQPIGHALAFKGRSGASQGWAFPLAKWPAGKYRLEITATDARGRTARAAVPFEVAE